MLTRGEIKYIQSLQDKKHRDAERRFVAEGTKWIDELIKWQPGWIEKIYASETWAKEHNGHILSEKLEVVKDFEMEKISALSHPAPALALVKKPIYTHQAFDEDHWNLVLDGIQDPGNMGTIIRIADWFGLKAIWCSSDTVDAFNPKVVQSAMGSLCRVKVFYADLEDLLSVTDLPICITGMEGRNVFETKAHSGILVIGNEGKGVRPGVTSKASHTLSIPRIGHAESLNAAVATGIMIARLTAGREPSKGH